ncbi:MAG: aminodeoxychorismate/anthranilate synthase component II [Pseudomonadota bacterium]
MTQANRQRVLMIDNYDSFTYNLVQAFAAQGAEMLVYRNDQITVSDARNLLPTHVVVSPGPGQPDGAGQSLAIIDAFAGSVPLLGVCLGHQCIVQHFGGRIVREGRLMHGKTSEIEHDGLGVFAGIEQPMRVGRYHSLGASAPDMPDELIVTATTERGEIMGVRHQRWCVEGVQFHPESVLTPEGETLMNNFLAMRIERSAVGA